MKTPKCCKNFMELKGDYEYSEVGCARMFFQCKKCGEVVTTNELL